MDLPEEQSTDPSGLDRRCIAQFLTATTYFCDEILGPIRGVGERRRKQRRTKVVAESAFRDEHKSRSSAPLRVGHTDPRLLTMESTLGLAVDASTLDN
jgi:hypothetical protein